MKCLHFLMIIMDSFLGQHNPSNYFALTLILDEFLLSPVSTEQTRELLEIIEARSVKGSVIFCTQFEPKGWYSRIGNDCDATICVNAK